MAQRFWVNTETMAASHKSVAVPMPKQCSFLYADTYTRNQMSEREVQQMALSNCNAKLNQLGPLGENYGVNCQCQVIISDGAYVVPRETLPDQAYGPASIFYRDDHGNVARLNGTAKYGALIGRDRSVTFSVDNPRAEPVCEGTFTNDGPSNGPLLAQLLQRQVRRQRHLREPHRQPERPHHRPRPDPARPADRHRDRPAGAARRQHVWRTLRCAAGLLLGLIVLRAGARLRPERGRRSKAASRTRVPAPGATACRRRARMRRPAPAPVASAAGRPRGPDYTTVLNSPEPDRRKLQESLRTLDKYNGPIDGNLSSEATMKGIAAGRRAMATPQSGKLTPTEAVALNNEAAEAPIKRLDPKVEAAAAPPPPPSNADRLKELQARLAERRKAAEPKANAATEALVKDLKAYVAADGKGVAGEQFAGFAKWYADTKSAGRTVGDIKPAVEDYGDAKAGAAATAEVTFDTKQGDSSGQGMPGVRLDRGQPAQGPAGLLLRRRRGRREVEDRPGRSRAPGARSRQAARRHTEWRSRGASRLEHASALDLLLHVGRNA